MTRIGISKKREAEENLYLFHYKSCKLSELRRTLTKWETGCLSLIIRKLKRKKELK